MWWVSESTCKPSAGRHNTQQVTKLRDTAAKTGDRTLQHWKSPWLYSVATCVRVQEQQAHETEQFLQWVTVRRLSCDLLSGADALALIQAHLSLLQACFFVISLFLSLSQTGQRALSTLIKTLSKTSSFWLINLNLLTPYWLNAFRVFWCCYFYIIK